MVDLSVSDYLSNARDGVGGLLNGVADAAVDAMCSIYYKSPGDMIAPAVEGATGSMAQRAFYDTLCAPKNKVPPIPSAPFTGGQCVGKTYNVNGSYVITVTGSTQHYSSPGLEGAIGGAVIRPVAGSSPTVYAVHVVYGVGSASGTRYFPVSGQDSNAGIFGSPTVDNVTVTGGGSDNCGNIPTYYPKVPLVDSDFSYTTNINITPTITVPVAVSINPTIVPVVGVFRPEFNVNVGGINVNMSLGGFTFAPTIQIAPGTTTPTGDPRALPPAPKTNNPTPDPAQTAIDLTQIKAKLDEIDQEIEDCCDALYPFQEPPNDKIRILLIGTGNSIDVGIPSKTFKVTCELTVKAANQKIQYGNNAPDVLYAGWAWFSDGVRQGDRLPVDSEFKMFMPPDRVSKRFCATLYGGYTGRFLAYYIE